MIRIDGRYVMRSRVVWSETNPDDPLLPGEVIHHINRVRDDDRPENLQKFRTHAEHTLHHKTGWTQSAAHVRKRVQASAERQYTVKSCGKAHSSCAVCRPDLYVKMSPEEFRARRNEQQRQYLARKRA